MTPPPTTPAPDVTIRRGQVNLNSRNTNVLAAAFVGMPIRDWDPTYATDGLGLGTLDINGANIAVQTMQNFIRTRLPNGMATNNVLQMIPWNSANLISSLNLTNEMDRKAFVRNSMDFFTARQQIYTIIVRADAMSYEYGGVGVGSSASTRNPAINGSVLGSAQAVFQVWRDPVPRCDNGPASAIQPCFIRLCKIMSL